MKRSAFDIAVQKDLGVVMNRLWYKSGDKFYGHYESFPLGHTIRVVVLG